MPSGARSAAPHFRKVLVLYRKTTFQTMVVERKDAAFLELIERKDPTVSKMETVHAQHTHCLEQVQKTLEDFGVPTTVLERSAVKKPAGYDLVVTVGGDGTFLTASHYLQDVPVLGVVSSQASVGHFCGADAATFPRVFGQLLEGKLPPSRLQRLQVTLGERPLPELALNELLFCHKNPASTSRYLVDLEGYREEQKSSGVWIATAAGSTAAIGSAGGTVLPPRSRRIQFLVREPYIGHRHEYKLLKGFVNADQKLEFASKMDEGKIFIDGPHISYPFRFGDRLTVALAENPLVVYGMRVE